jgi:Phosphotransferase enzyme family
MLRQLVVRSRAKIGDEAALLRRVAHAAGVSAAQVEVRLQSLWGGYGELLRVTLEDGRSAIVKHVRPPRDDGSVSHRRKLRSYEVERAFYARYSARCLEAPGIRVPRAYGALATEDGWLFVLEDLDASGFGERRASASDAEIRATLRWLARFHARFLGVSPEQLWRVGTYWHLATRPDELGALRHGALRQAAGRIDEALSSAQFKTLVHGDAKLENVCFSEDASHVALVDFQYVGGGVGVKDVAYFLSSCLAPPACERWVPSYLDCYFEELARVLNAADAEQVEQEWRALFPLAWVDFYRFFLGWAPGEASRDAYSERLTREVLARFKSD